MGSWPYEGVVGGRASRSRYDTRTASSVVGVRRASLACAAQCSRVNCVPEISLAEILVLAGTSGAGGMAPPTSNRISARMECVQGHVSLVGMVRGRMQGSRGRKPRSSSSRRKPSPRAPPSGRRESASPCDHAPPRSPAGRRQNVIVVASTR